MTVHKVFAQNVKKNRQEVKMAEETESCSFDDINQVIACRVNDLVFVVEKEGRSNFKKASYPIRYGKYSEIRTKDHEFHFNLKGEIKFIRGTGRNWPHPSEWLKRSDGNDWSYYSVGAVNNFKRIKALAGEYYLPFPTYPTNSIIEFNLYTNPGIANAFASWSQLYANLCGIQPDSLPPKIRKFVNLVIENNENRLFEQAQKLHSIIGGDISVLPPDSRHVDYEIIPVNIADGCLYNCRFCCVKSGRKLQIRSWDNIHEQITGMKIFHGENLQNYNSIFLGNHDALGAGKELICRTADEAFNTFGFGRTGSEIPVLFMFGSVGTFLGSGQDLFDSINSLPYRTYINIGLESVDAETLAFINKPLTPSKVKEAFHRMLEINREYPDIEVSANFLLGEQLPPGHRDSLAELLGSISDKQSGKGSIYLSPLKDSLKKEELLRSFFEIKGKSMIDTWIYLIQRL